jgi:uncharacterized repeat protein (TIGR03806 family)
MTNFLRLCWALVLLFGVVSCHTDPVYEEVVPDPVQCDLTQVPYAKLSDYHLFTGELSALVPSVRVVPYRPNSELFSDYALKKRFVWLPKGSKGQYVNDYSPVDLPVGAALIKHFYYENVGPNLHTQHIETRVMIRKADGWIFAEYVWNDDQTEAFLTTQKTSRNLQFERQGISYNFTYTTPNPATECFRCHGNYANRSNHPLGIKPQNLNGIYNYESGALNQLEYWKNKGLLNDNLPSAITSTVNYLDASQPFNLRIRSYFDSQCAHCHNDVGDARQMNLRFEFARTEDATQMGVGQQAIHTLIGYGTRLIQPNNPGQSIMYYRITTTTDAAYRMPVVGRTLRHEEGIQLVADWINSL